MKFQLIASSLFCMRSVHGFTVANGNASTSRSGLASIRTNNKPATATVPTTTRTSEASSNNSHNHSSSALHASTLKDTFSSILIGAFIGASAMNINANPAHATDTVTDISLLSSSSSSLVLLQSSSSSIHISKTITTMEFSLPSSYDTISSATASGTNELTVETDTITNTSRKKVTSSTSSTSSDNGFSLPSFGGGNGNDNSNLSDEERAALAAERKAEREALALLKSAEREAIAAEKAAEKEAIAQAKSAERDAIAQQQAQDNERLAIQRQKEKVERKEAALVQKAVQDEKSASKASNSKFKGAEFVDFSMPSYDKAGVDGQKDSVFAL
eukprot:CAMPEP_0194110888 /NCGR_PEP_ID=MMETSP0150-20130528/10039_1 /TAXON_ID=122233 /ORGANISM="Chaetoceros debilis, Strain MM31A-1" /LENGTH=329 /DNA_ID=CAMNT_0038800183 /DNA_START=119 /DNA_END=1108 /DNA_ORIENTATION=+